MQKRWEEMAMRALWLITAALCLLWALAIDQPV